MLRAARPGAAERGDGGRQDRAQGAAHQAAPEGEDEPGDHAPQEPQPQVRETKKK